MMAPVGWLAAPPVLFADVGELCEAELEPGEAEVAGDAELEPFEAMLEPFGAKPELVLMLMLMLDVTPLVLTGVAAAATLVKNATPSAFSREATAPVEPAALIQAGVATDWEPENANASITVATSLGMSAPLAPEMVLSSDLTAGSLLTWEETLARSSETCD